MQFVDEEEFARGNREFMDAFRQGGGTPGTASLLPARAGNLETVLRVDATGALLYRKRRFRVPPVPFRSAMALAELQLELARVDEQQRTPGHDRLQTLQDQLHCLKTAAALMYGLIRPATLWDRLTWRFRANPFLAAEASELTELFHFFCKPRMTAPVVWTWLDRASYPWPILPPNGPLSSMNIPLGYAPAEPSEATP